MGRRTLLLISALLIAALGTALVWLYVRGADQRAIGNQVAVKVWVTKSAVAVGTKANVVLSEQYTDVRDVAQGLAAGALTDAAQVRNLQTTVPIPAGVVISAGYFSSADQSLPQLKISPKKVAVSVQVGDPQRVAGFLTQGSNIGIFLTLTKNSSAATGAKTDIDVTRLVLDKVKVLTTGSTATQPVSRTVNGQTTTQALPQSIVTVELAPDEAEKLIHAQSAGDLYFVLLNPEESAVPTDPKYKSGVTTSDLLQ